MARIRKIRAELIGTRMEELIIYEAYAPTGCMDSKSRAEFFNGLIEIFRTIKPTRERQ